MYERLPAFAPGSPLDLPPARAYGQAPSDLDIEFGWQNRPALVTTVLAQCCERDDASAEARQEAAWSLPLGRRIVRLLQIVELSTGSDALPLTLRCLNGSCGQPFEIALGFAPLLASAPATEPGADMIPFPLGNTTTVALRLPTGRDQSTWQKQTYATVREATAAIVHSLLTNPPTELIIAPEYLDPIAAAMEEADPLVAFYVVTQCPNCSSSVDVPIDLEQVSLQKLAGLRRILLREIHALATRYGWSEDEILALSSVRRAEYLRLIAEAEETLP